MNEKKSRGPPDRKKPSRFLEIMILEGHNVDGIIIFVEILISNRLLVFYGREGRGFELPGVRVVVVSVGLASESIARRVAVAVLND